MTSFKTKVNLLFREFFVGLRFKTESSSPAEVWSSRCDWELCSKLGALINLNSYGNIWGLGCCYFGLISPFMNFLILLTIAYYWMVCSLFFIFKNLFRLERDRRGWWMHPGRLYQPPLFLEVDVLWNTWAGLGFFPLAALPRVCSHEAGPITEAWAGRTRGILFRMALSCTAAKLELLPLDCIGSCVCGFNFIFC